MVRTCLHEDLLTRLVRVCLVDQQKQILDYLLKLLQQKSVTFLCKSVQFWLTFNVIAKNLNSKLTFNVIVPSLLMSKTRNICLRFSSEKVSLNRKRFFCINFLFRLFLFSVFPFIFVTWRTIGHDIQDNHELAEVNVAILRVTMWHFFYPLFSSSLYFFALSRK